MARTDLARRTRIKFCGLVRPDDVRTAVALGVDAIGMVFYPRSARFLSLEAARELRDLLPSWVSVVGLFVNAEPEVVRDHIARVGLDVVQFHGDETAAQCVASLGPRQIGDGAAPVPWWRAVRMRSADDLITSVPEFAAAEALLVDAWSAGYGGSGESFDWSLVPPADQRHDWSLILSGGLHAGNVGEAITRLAPLAVDVSTGIQGLTARIKEISAMESFVAAVLAADAKALERNA